MPMRDYIPKGGTSQGQRLPPGLSRVFIVALVLLALITVFVLVYVKAQHEYVQTDPNTLCPLNRPITAVIVVLLDMSDQFSEPQRLKVLNELERLKEGMPRFALIEVYAVDRLGERVTTPMVHLCNPGTGEDLNRFYQNPELAREKWTAFSQHLDSEVRRLMATPDSPTSPIFEAIQATALRTFNRPEYDGITKRLIVVSDLLQNVPGKYSQYEGVQPFSGFRTSSYFTDVRADLSGVKVTLFYLIRPATPQKWPDHYRFWEEYFLAQGATVELLEPVYGAQ